MTKIKDYIQLHLNILLFSLTSVFSKLASVYYNKEGLHSPLLYVFLFLMIANCGIYAIAWQQVIKKFSLSTAYANKSVYLLWSQVWAVIIFHANLSVQNMNRTFMLIMLAGTFFSAISQVLLKQSANMEYKNPLREYLNWRVILAYGIFFGVLLLNTWCYTKVDMKFGPVIDTAAYVFVLLFSWRILKEKISRGKIIGNLIIILGILVYTL